MMGIEGTKKLKLVLSPSEIITELRFDQSNLAEEFKPKSLCCIAHTQHCRYFGFH